MKKILIWLVLCWFPGWLLAAGTAGAAFTEPSMSDYTAMPVFTAQSVQPNIMIILDNSGSMNYLAYDETFAGEPYYAGIEIASAEDDAEEYATGSQNTWTGSGDLDLAGHSVDANDSIVGLRFQDVLIPQGTTINSAYISFVAYGDTSAATDLLIEGEASDNADPFVVEVDNIKNRTSTTNTVAWNSVPAWTNGQRYQTPDLTAIVQEIVNRGGWASGNAMVFRITGTSGRRNARAWDYSSGAYTPMLHVDFDTVRQGKLYYGYFNPDYFYNYDQNRFNLTYKKIRYDSTSSSWNVETLAGGSATLNDSDIVSQALWDGNWLNWLCMRRVDALRKVLMGGLATARTGGGNQVNYGEDSTYGYQKTMNTTFTPAVSPYDGNYTYTIDNGEITVNGDDYFIRIQKDINYEPNDFYEGNLAGVLQRIGDKARWANTWFNYGTGNNNSGGTVQNTMGTNMTSLITDLQNESCGGWTPLAETMYVATQYFKQEDVQSGLDYPNNAVPIGIGGVKDPYYDKDAQEMIDCAKSFVILLTDGASTMDAKVPEFLKDYDNDGNDNSTCSDCGTNFLDDVALYARTTDLRDDLDGDQHIILYNIYAFDNDNTARSLLRDASRNGGFEDRNGNNQPDGDYTDPPEDRLEWDENGDGEPDTYFEASDGYALEAQLLNAITDILKRASSGTAASVLATNNQGAGNSVQSYFRPLVSVGLEEARWLGYLHSLWVDPWGNLREDSNANLELDLRSSGSQNAADGNVDKIVQVINAGSDIVVRKFTSHYLYNSDNGESGECKVADCNPVFQDMDIANLLPLFEAGKQLAQRDFNTLPRKIFTYVGDSGVVASGDDSFDVGGDVILFNSATASELKPFLGVKDNAAWGDNGAGLGNDHDTRVTNIINWIRGTDVTGLRNRTLNGETWRLGDIVHSTPLVVGKANEYYHQIYQDEEYVDFINYTNNRETVVYMGANDGMLHAFTSYVAKQDADENLYYEKLSATSETIGDELWAYIPQSVLPHLKWTASENYTHTYYVNGEVRVFDAKILPDNMYYSDDDSNPNYGTFMVFGLNMGGKTISVYEDFGTGDEEREFSPTYVLMDITDPRNPRLMWERTYSGLGLNSSTPAPVRVGSRDGNNSQWFLVFGSGPTDYDGNSNQKGHIFVVDLLTGAPFQSEPGKDWIWESPANDSYFNSPLALDLFWSNNVDSIYLAENFISGGQWQADVHKIAIPCSKCIWDEDANGMQLYDVDELEYSNDPFAWGVTKLFEAKGPVSVKMTFTKDPWDNALLYFGTGRYIFEDDKTDTNQQYLYCVKDPFYNKEKYEADYYHNFSNALTLTDTDLLQSDGITVTTFGNVSGYGSGDLQFWDFVEEIRALKDGWYLSLQTNGSEPSERIITQTAILGGIFLTPVFTPTVEICGMGGETSFLGGYFETGTGYILPVFYKLENPTVEQDVNVRGSQVFLGMPPSKFVFHLGQEEGATATIQLGTGEFITFYNKLAKNPGDMTTEMFDDPTQKPMPNPACDWE